MGHAMILSTEALNTLNNARALPLLAVAAIKVAVCVTTWTTRVRTRRALAKLDKAQLADVGLTLEQAKYEAARVFWKA